ncbi:hypothetical protein BS50DRAFT_644342 [Corynespora cassiicola Philippines]|uniref:Uncharacterized protein n=1 Tax=Corynespora cassiicola Philippines TaxID=1448308 RepID=A0A2T2PCQ6_CORCC|nr:hypothetical protein BS50DRAFT_644342 [Corynespora cassiicola Philippines]
MNIKWTPQPQLRSSYQHPKQIITFQHPNFLFPTQQSGSHRPFQEPKKYTDMEQERKELQEYQRKTGITSDNFKKSASQYYAEAPAPELLYFEASLAIATGPLDDFLEDIKNHSEWKNPDYTAAREACETQTICSALEDLKIAGVEKMDDMMKGVESRAKNEAIRSAKHMEDNKKRDILRPVCSPLALFALSLIETLNRDRDEYRFPEFWVRCKMLPNLLTLYFGRKEPNPYENTSHNFFDVLPCSQMGITDFKEDFAKSFRVALGVMKEEINFHPEKLEESLQADFFKKIKDGLH